MIKPNPLTPDPVLFCKLGSIIVHAEELLSPDGHQFDKITFDQLMRDPAVVQWLADMRKMALLPEKRNG